MLGRDTTTNALCAGCQSKCFVALLCNLMSIGAIWAWYGLKESGQYLHHVGTLEPET